MTALCSTAAWGLQRVFLLRESRIAALQGPGSQSRHRAKIVLQNAILSGSGDPCAVPSLSLTVGFRLAGHGPCQPYEWLCSSGQMTVARCSGCMCFLSVIFFRVLFFPLSLCPFFPLLLSVDIGMYLGESVSFSLDLHLSWALALGLMKQVLRGQYLVGPLGFLCPVASAFVCPGNRSRQAAS